ncbi:MAG: Cof-type HAD-IIB family hydrolase [Actinomycetota bacterium]|nr:Cof-type HAD-IIB family hydrolase [Actinomycetota bacterium]
MTFSPKLVALDVDGTLVDGDNNMSPAVREAVWGLRDKGIETVITTGRAIPGVMTTVDKLGFDDGIAIGSNGAVVFSYAPPVVLHSVTFDASAAVALILARVPDAMVAVEEMGVGYRVNKHFPDGEIGGQITLHSVEELVEHPVSRVIIRAPEHSAEEFGAIVSEIGLTGTSYYIGYSAWVDLAPEGVSKASGLEFVCERLGVDVSEVLAVGDGHNDYEMLEWAGRGVAMGHAPDRVKLIADDVTGSVEQDGLATELQRYL